MILLFIHKVNNIAFSWTRSLVSTLSGPSKALLEVCLPCMKYDHRILMEFLPHILLHSLLEGDQQDVNNAYVEVSTVINSFNNQRVMDEAVINVCRLKCYFMCIYIFLFYLFIFILFLFYELLFMNVVYLIFLKI